ncbi:MAG: PD-(D/E)XK nuclease family protein [Lachnospiraceae bacterium]|nr:PD-(D/E)XK nuclease family protein [Lachnospiraceae bacterium]
MALQMYIGCSGSGKSHKLYEHIIDESLKHPELTYLILVPEQYNLSTQRQLISMHPRKGILNIDVLSFTRIAHRVFEEVGYSRAKGATIDDIGKNLILRHMANEHEDKLTALSGMFKKLGYISEVKSVISEFMQYGIGDKELGYLIEKSSSRVNLKSKLTDIRILYNEFLKYINEKYITTEEILEKVRDIVPTSDKLGKSIIVLDGYTGFTPVQLKLIGALLEKCVDVYLTVLLDTNSDADIHSAAQPSGSEDLFYMSKKTISSMDRLCRERNIVRKPDVIIKDSRPARFMYDDEGGFIPEDRMSSELVHLEKNLFRVYEKQYEGSGNGDIHIFYGTDPDEEAVEAAVRIQKLVRDEGYHYKDIAVVSGDIDTYMHACTRAFVKYDIPVFVDKTIPILLNPMVECIRALLDIVIEDFSYEAMFRYLRSGMSDTGMQINDGRSGTDILENYILKYGIKGRKQWETAFIKKTGDMEEAELESLNDIRRSVVGTIVPFCDELAQNGETDGEADIRVIATALYRFMAVNRLQERMQRLSEDFDRRGDKVRAKEYDKLYEEICDLLDKMVRLLPGEVISVKEFSQLLDAGLAEIRTGVIPPSDDYVQIGDITRTRLREIKALFFMGVNDGIVPMNSTNGGIISDIEREFLTENDDLNNTEGGEGIELAPTARMKAYTQRLYLYMLVTKPRRRLYISYSKLDTAGQSINPSYFVKMIMHMFPSVKVETPDEGTGNRVYNKNSGEEHLATAVRDIEAGVLNEPYDRFSKLFDIFALDPTDRFRLQILLQAAFMKDDQRKNDRISRAVARALYGEELTCSVTRLERYAACAYSHFLMYGLSLKQRELFSFEAKDMGSVFHDTLKEYAQILKERNLSWLKVDEKDSDEVIEEAIQRCISKDGYGAIYGSFRTQYVINRMRRITKRTVNTLTEQLKKGSFEPEKFEVAFDSGNELKSLNIELPGTGKIRLIGRIDRLDTYSDGTSVYVKVIDYKSGNKSFDLAAVYFGLDLQLVVYMSAAMEMLGDSSIPAGILYYHIDDPVIKDESGEVPDKEKINEEIFKQLKMKGLVNSDPKIYRLIDGDFTDRSTVIPVSIKKDGDFGSGSSVASTEDFRIISGYVTHKIGEMGTEILNGYIKAEPHKKSITDRSPCVYCDYSGICGYRAEGIAEDISDETSENTGGDNDERNRNEKIIDAMKSEIMDID